MFTDSTTHTGISVQRLPVKLGISGIQEGQQRILPKHKYN